MVGAYSWFNTLAGLIIYGGLIVIPIVLLKGAWSIARRGKNTTPGRAALGAVSAPFHLASVVLAHRRVRRVLMLLVLVPLALAALVIVNDHLHVGTTYVVNELHPRVVKIAPWGRCVVVDATNSKEYAVCPAGVGNFAVCYINADYAFKEIRWVQTKFSAAANRRNGCHGAIGAVNEAIKNSTGKPAFANP